ncbi:CRISPR-associated protein Cas5 [Heyndrickxia coagulans]|uniref:CRISPR-associated protein Cas5 n=1 Tax=Heyndrickxia coagulans TaxID=1398 RepID=UPI0006288A15|nr:CRISPR-associated protein Cas5 [Heyndrickxia coagulans]
MEAVVFDLKSDLAHFRRPDTTSTQLTYPFISPTAMKGIAGAVLGIEDFTTRDKIGIQLLHPVKTVSQQMSMLGKDSGNTFNRPTTIELVVKPFYRIYYAGDEYVRDLHHFLSRGRAVYPTYLGSAYAITKPVWHAYFKNVEVLQDINQPVETKCIVPSRLISELNFESGCYYSRAGGFMQVYKGGREFEKSIDFVYERNGKTIQFLLDKRQISDELQIVQIGDETVCLF